jgi:hypothetical protein
MDAQDDRPGDPIGLAEDVDPQHCSIAGRDVDVTLDDDVGRWIGDGNRGFSDGANPV